VIDGISAAALEAINAILGPSRRTIDLIVSTRCFDLAAGLAGRLAVPPIPRKRSRSVAVDGPKLSCVARKRAAPSMCVSGNADEPRPTAPTAKMVAYAQVLRAARTWPYPEGYERDFKACRRFLDEHARVGRHPFRRSSWHWMPASFPLTSWIVQGRGPTPLPSDAILCIGASDSVSTHASFSLAASSFG